MSHTNALSAANAARLNAARGHGVQPGQFGFRHHSAPEGTFTSATAGDDAPAPVVELTDDAHRQLLATALWSSSDEHGDSLDAAYDLDDIDPASAQRLRDEFDDFVNGGDDDAAATIQRVLARDDYSQEQLARDWWLTRNHHGAGFWDRGLGEDGATLTSIAHGYGEADLYVGDDGKVHYDG